MDYNYTVNCPLDWPYVALYAAEDEDSGRASKGDPEMWARVEKAMKNGTLKQLKNELTVIERGSDKHKATGSDNLSKGRADEEDDEDEDPDAGFFE